MLRQLEYPRLRPRSRLRGLQAWAPSKKDYRKFNIRSVEGPDDYASMREVVTRRYRRLSEEAGGEGLPDLILADGGKGQIGAIREALAELGLATP